ncbi:hypothetical protein ACFSQ3_01635 [Sphingobacterium corticis]|uniref:Uncharacterized protein n=1 Tax=Sphingobacterium corticis TaxID=1812823 RepID=A0ABW5NIB6_9SPHI
MRRFLTYMLLIALTLQSFYRVVMTLDYQIHLPDYLAKCINRDKPELHCNGQCILMQKIRDKERQESESKLATYEFSLVYIHQESLSLETIKPIEEVAPISGAGYFVRKPSNHLSDIFRPPMA